MPNPPFQILMESKVMKRTALILSMAVMCLAFVRQLPAQETADKTIPETAIAAGNFKTLVAAVKTAGLLETLAGEGPFTVLAPTDEAFAKLPKGTVKSLLKPENKKKLVAMLKLHATGLPNIEWNTSAPEVGTWVATAGLSDDARYGLLQR